MVRVFGPRSEYRADDGTVAGIDLGFGQGDEQVTASFSEAAIGASRNAVLVNSILSGIGNSTGLAKKANDVR